MKRGFVQFIDLQRQYQRIEKSIQTRMNKVLQHGKYILGPEISELENLLGEYSGAHYCISCASGTDALLLPLMAYGIGPGDAVFVPPFTFIATAEVISLLGATPIFVDIDPHTYNIDPVKLTEVIRDMKAGKMPTKKMPAGLRLRGAIPVDIFGLPADYEALKRIADDNGLFLFEDAAQSFGGIYKGKKTCSSLTDVAATSFFPAKPLGCYGDGGAIFTNSKETAKILESLRVHGQGSDKYNNVRIGINGRMDTLQAAVLLAKMEIFDKELAARQEVARRYSALLQDRVETPVIPEGYTSAWAQYSVLSDERTAIMERLKRAGIPTAIYYPKPLHLQDAFSYLGYEKGQMPVSEAVANRIFSVPMHPYLSENEQKEIVGCF
jgi:UDP-2-acetamido-2-deoxy-ribo-hexuluronate aminotransferase